MAFTNKDVMDLRAKTGVGMMDCKKALTEADGDMEKAIELLREKGKATSEKRAGKIASQGIVDTYISGNTGVILEVASTAATSNSARIRRSTSRNSASSTRRRASFYKTGHLRFSIITRTGGFSGGFPGFSGGPAIRATVTAARRHGMPNAPSGAATGGK